MPQAHTGVRGLIVARPPVGPAWRRRWRRADDAPAQGKRTWAWRWVAGSHVAFQAADVALVARGGRSTPTWLWQPGSPSPRPFRLCCGPKDAVRSLQRATDAGRPAGELRGGRG